MSGGANRFTVERRAIPDAEVAQLRHDLKASAGGSLVTLVFSAGCVIGAVGATILAIKAPTSNGTFAATAIVFVVGFALSFPLMLAAAGALVVRRGRSRRFEGAIGFGVAEVFRFAPEGVFLIDDAGAHSGAILLRCVNAQSPHAWLYVAAGILDDRLLVVERDEDDHRAPATAPNSMRAVGAIHRLPAPDGGIIQIEDAETDVDVRLLDPAVLEEDEASAAGRDARTGPADPATSDPVTGPRLDDDVDVDGSHPFDPPVGEDECFLIDAAALPGPLRRFLESR